MFGRIKCKRCTEKIGKKYNFCPHCGFSQKGKSSEFFEPSFDLGFPFNLLTKKLFKDLEKQLQNLNISEEPTLDENFDVTEGFPRNIMGISINIDTKNGNPVIRVKSLDKNNKGFPEKSKIKIINPEITPEKAEKFANLPKKEPETQITRLTNKLIYEINLPGVQKEDILIRRLENSIEIKAFSEDKAFTKIIPLSLPLLKSHLKEGKLTLELKL